jgi:hypothetical protein
MMFDTPSPTELSRIIGQITAPAFLLGAVAAYIALLLARLRQVIDRTQELNQIADDDKQRVALKADIPRLHRRARLLNRSVEYAAISSIVVTALMVVAFVSAFIHVQHEHGVALLFLLALGFFAAALINLVRETRIALHEFDFHK